jgi:hypothetical protein
VTWRRSTAIGAVATAASTMRNDEGNDESCSNGGSAQTVYAAHYGYVA